MATLVAMCWRITVRRCFCCCWRAVAVCDRERGDGGGGEGVNSRDGACLKNRPSACVLPSRATRLVLAEEDAGRRGTSCIPSSSVSVSESTARQAEGVSEIERKSFGEKPYRKRLAVERERESEHGGSCQRCRTDSVVGETLRSE